MNIPTSTATLPLVRWWLSKVKKKYGDDWKSAVNRAIYEDKITDIHREIVKHLRRRKP